MPCTLATSNAICAVRNLDLLYTPQQEQLLCSPSVFLSWKAATKRSQNAEHGQEHSDEECSE
jgi:hypothetical protein